MPPQGTRLRHGYYTSRAARGWAPTRRAECGQFLAVQALQTASDRRQILSLRLELGLQSLHSLGQPLFFLCKLRGTFFQGLDAHYEDPVHIPGVDGNVRSNGADAVVAEGAKEVLGDRPIVTELFGILADVVPTGNRQSREFRERRLGAQRLEVFFSVFVRSEGIGHVTFDNGDCGIAQANFVTGIDNGAAAYGRGVV